MPGAKWFEGARLNFAENLLRYRDDQVALIFQSEGQAAGRITYAELYAEVARVAQALREYGVTAGDRIAGFMPNRPETTIAMLAATSIGATWSSCSPDFGIKGVLDRFGQIRPKILFTADGYFFKGKPIDSLNSISKIIEQLPCVKKVIVVPFICPELDISGVSNAVHFKCIGAASHEIDFQQLPFDHPLYIMYSSGTTGLPKCMVQSAGGILIHHLKELMLHTDLKREDTIFYFTTCGWMMWNWLTTSLAVGATLVLYDGNPFHPDPGVLWRMAQEQKITVFGTSAGYLGALKNTGAQP
jgi:acetoacetyl-CoA synthetase